MLELDFKKIKVAYGLIMDIKGYQELFFLSSDLFISKNMTVILLGGTSAWHGV
jgi:hypothetical protein